MNLSNRDQIVWFWKSDMGLAVFQAKISHTTYQIWWSAEKWKKKKEKKKKYSHWLTVHQI